MFKQQCNSKTSINSEFLPHKLSFTIRHKILGNTVKVNVYLHDNTLTSTKSVTSLNLVQ